MAPIGLELRLVPPAAWAGATRGALRETTERLATLRWPEELAAEAQAFLRDNLFAERLGDARRAHAALFTEVHGLHGVGCIAASERTRFLADRPTFLPEPPERLAAALDLEDLVAEFAAALTALRTAPKELDLALVWLFQGDARPG